MNCLVRHGTKYDKEVHQGSPGEGDQGTAQVVDTRGHVEPSSSSSNFETQFRQRQREARSAREGQEVSRIRGRKPQSHIFPTPGRGTVMTIEDPRSKRFRTELIHLQQEHQGPVDLTNAVDQLCSNTAATIQGVLILLTTPSLIKQLQILSTTVNYLVTSLTNLSFSESSSYRPTQTQPASQATSHIPAPDERFSKDSFALSLDYAMSDVSLSEEHLNLYHRTSQYINWSKADHSHHINDLECRWSEEQYFHDQGHCSPILPFPGTY